MKTTAIAIATILAATIGFAAETTVQPTTTSAESPLVRAAKKNDRSKKRIVITNESLKSSTGHVTTTKSQPAVYQPPRLSEAEYQALHPPTARPNTEKAAEKKPETAAAQKARVERLANEEAEGPFSEADPAALEHQLEKNTQQAPKQEPKKP